MCVSNFWTVTICSYREVPIWRPFADTRGDFDIFHRRNVSLAKFGVGSITGSDRMSLLKQLGSGAL